jgi:hypothetical protein
MTEVNSVHQQKPDRIEDAVHLKKRYPRTISRAPGNKSRILIARPIFWPHHQLALTRFQRKRDRAIIPSTIAWLPPHKTEEVD